MQFLCYWALWIFELTEIRSKLGATNQQYEIRQLSFTSGNHYFFKILHVSNTAKSRVTLKQKVLMVSI